MVFSPQVFGELLPTRFAGRLVGLICRWRLLVLPLLLQRLQLRCRLASSSAMVSWKRSRCSALMASALAPNFQAFRRASSNITFSSLASLNLISCAWRSMCWDCFWMWASICWASSATALDDRPLRSEVLRSCR
jgi:hypothetical protein